MSDDMAIDSTRVARLLDAVVRHDLYAVEAVLKEELQAISSLEDFFAGTSPAASALHLAARQGDVDTMKLLARYGAPMEARDSRGQCVIHVAAAANLHSLRYLLAAGADVSAVEYSARRTVLHFMASSDITCEAIPEVVALGATVEACCESGLTPLFSAVKQMHLPGVREMLEAGASANVVDDEGDTPLSGLKVLENTEVQECARLLLAAGADPHARNGTGTSFWDMCAHLPEFREKIAALDALRAVDRVLGNRLVRRDRER